MFARLPYFALVGVVLAAGWFYFQGGGPPTPPPVACTCRDLAESPALYAGKRVRVDTSHCVRDTPKTLVWRRAIHLDPAVVLRYPGAFGEPLPPHLTGLCHAPLAGGPVTIDCR